MNRIHAETNEENIIFEHEKMDNEEDDFDTDDWDMSMDSDFENYLNKMMSHAIDRPRP